MRAKAIAAVLALGVALLALPAGAGAKPGFARIPGSDFASMFVRGPHGYFVLISVRDGRASLVAQRPNRDKSHAVLIYERTVAQPADDHLHFGLGRAGEVDVHLVTGKVEEREPSKGCTGDPLIIRSGRFVGRITIHPPGGFIDIDAHRAVGGVAHGPPRVCRRRPSRNHHSAHHADGEVSRRLVAGSRDGKERFEAVAFYPFSKAEPESTYYFASVTREEGPLTITALTSAFSIKEYEVDLTVPDLSALPATVVVEPPAPFFGSATFDLPSRRTATLSGDLGVELPAFGRVPLTGANIEPGVCRGFSCTRSLPKALRPKPSTAEIVAVSGNPPEEVPTR